MGTCRHHESPRTCRATAPNTQNAERDQRARYMRDYESLPRNEINYECVCVCVPAEWCEFRSSANRMFWRRKKYELCVYIAPGICGAAANSHALPFSFHSLRRPRECGSLKRSPHMYRACIYTNSRSLMAKAKSQREKTLYIRFLRGGTTIMLQYTSIYQIPPDDDAQQTSSSTRGAISRCIVQTDTIKWLQCALLFYH